MSHGMTENDRQEARTMAWHGLTTLNQELSLKNNALNKEYVGKDQNGVEYKGWDLERVPCYIPVSVNEKTGKPSKFEMAIASIEEELNEAEENGETPKPTAKIRAPKVNPWTILRCTDKPEISIGAPYNPGTFTPIDNKTFLEIIERSLKGTEHQVESVMSCENRATVAVTIRFKELDKFTGAGREFEAFLVFIQANDKSKRWVCVTSNVCAVCANTIAMNLTHEGKLVDVHLKHGKNILATLANLPELIQAAIATQKTFALNMDKLQKRAVTHTGAKQLLFGYFCSDFVLDADPEKQAALNAGFKISPQTRNRVEEILSLFHNDGPGHGNFGRDMSDLFQAWTDFYTHGTAGAKSAKNPWKTFVSSEMGRGNTAKLEFWEAIQDEAKCASLTAIGQAVLLLPEPPADPNAPKRGPKPRK